MLAPILAAPGRWEAGPMIESVAAPPSVPSEDRPAALVDYLLPTYDVSDGVGVVVDAEPRDVWEALLEADLMEVGRRRPAVGLLGALRGMPDLFARVLRGDGLPSRPERMRLIDLAGEAAADGGWILLECRENEELALGLVGKFWRPAIRFADVPPNAFRSFAEPGWAKTVYDLKVTPLGEGRSFLSGTMRTATTDRASRKWFRRYWTFGVGSGAHVLVGGLLEVVAETAVAGATPPAAAGSRS